MWLLVTVIGVTILGAVLLYGQRSSDQFRRHRFAVARRESATEHLYDDEEAERHQREDRS